MAASPKPVCQQQLGRAALELKKRESLAGSGICSTSFEFWELGTGGLILLNFDKLHATATPYRGLELGLTMAELRITVDGMRNVVPSWGRH